MERDEIIYGIHSVSEAIMAGKEVGKVLIQQNFSSEGLTGLIREMRARGIPYQHIPRERFLKFRGKSHQGILAFISPIEFTEVSQVVPMLFEQGKVPLLAVLDNVTDVRNIGAIARGAECMGVHALVLASKGVGMINADAIKTSAGALMSLPVCRERSLVNSMQYLKDSGIQLIGCSEKAEATIETFDLNIPLALVLGAEDEGISPSVARMLHKSARISMSGTIQSLNVSVAAGIIFHEAQKQRLKLPT